MDANSVKKTESNSRNFLFKIFSSTELFLICTFWLMVLLVVGTLAQRDIGIYLAQERYFSAWWVHWILLPLPGGRLTMFIIFFNMIVKIVFDSTWRLKKIGIHISHIGALMLLLGGFLTAYFSSEGRMVIDEGDRSSFYVDDIHLELAVIDTGHPDHDTNYDFAQGWLKPGKKLHHPGLDFQIEVIQYYRNCKLLRRDGKVSAIHKGLSHHYEMQPLVLEKELGANRAGILFRIDGSKRDDENGIYLTAEHMNTPLDVNIAGKPYRILLRHAKLPLGFGIELLDFEKKLYPGTEKAKSFKSVVHLLDNDIKRRVIISMNQPLRYKGYTFFQASYIEDGEQETTILAVVKNAGRLFPYISSIIICIGLFIHLMILLPVLLKRKNETPV